MLIIEGRLPDFSQNGRREGSHCWPVFPNSKKECCDQDITDKSTMVCFIPYFVSFLLFVIITHVSFSSLLLSASIGCIKQYIT